MVTEIPDVLLPSTQFSISQPFSREVRATV
jgi:hypothetical protein